MQISAHTPHYPLPEASKAPLHSILKNTPEDIQSIQKNIHFRANSILESGDAMRIDYTYTDHDAISDVEQLLMNNNKTFYLFEGALHHALEKGYGHTGPVKIPLYIADIRDKNFITILEQKKQAGLNVSNIMLNIRSEDYGLIDSVAMSNLINAEKLGYQIAMENAFRAKGTVIEASERFKKIDSILQNPVQTSIDAELYKKYEANELRATDKQIDEKIQQSTVVHFVKKNVDALTHGDPINYDTFINFFRESSVMAEPMFDKAGDLMRYELLFRHTYINTQEALSMLKKLSGTEALLQYTLEKAVEKIRTEKIPTTVNIFLKDLASPLFQYIIKKTLGYNDTNGNKWSGYKGGLMTSEKNMVIFEILEDEYGQMNEQALENIRFIKNTLKAKIAIDDFHDEGIASAGNISAETLGILDEFKNKFKQENSDEVEILPDFIKIDGKTVRGILDNSINPRYISHLRELIGIYSLYNVEFIFEWIQTTEEAMRIDELFQIKKINPATGKIIDGAKFSYQGEKLKEYQFGTRNLSKVTPEIAEKKYA